MLMIILKMILVMTMMIQLMHTEMSGVSEKAGWTMLTLGKGRLQVHTMQCRDDNDTTMMVLMMMIRG